MLAMALEAEIQAFIEHYSSIKNAQGKATVIHNGYLPERTITTSEGTISVKVPRSRSTVSNLKPFLSALIPKYMRKSLSIEEALPLFYLRELLLLPPVEDVRLEVVVITEIRNRNLVNKVSLDDENLLL